MTDSPTHLKWPTFSRLSEIARQLDSSLSLTGILGQGVPEITETLLRWYPSIAVGSESRHVKSTFYFEKGMLLEGKEFRQFLPLLVRTENAEIIAFISFQVDTDARSLTSPLGIVAPTFRGKGIAYFGPKLLEAIAREMSCGFAYYYVTTETIAQQKVAEALNFSLLGVMPAWDRDLIEGIPQRVTELIYGKIMQTDEPIRMLSAANLTERSIKIIQELLPGALSGE